MSKWYENIKWRNLVDMHIPDWREDFMSKFDPAQYAENMKTAGIELSELYTGNCLGICFFPTKVGHKHNGIGDMDLVGETLKELKKRGIERMPYFNIWSRWAFDNHPEWRIIRSDGRNTLYGNIEDEEWSRYGRCCLNSDGYREYVKEQIRQIVTDYEGKGLWVDMPMWHGICCHCDSCKEKFKNKTGFDIPKVEDWDSPVWTKYMRFREESTVEFAKMISDTAKEIKPELSVIFNTAAIRSNIKNAGATEEYYRVSDYMAGDFYGNFLMYSTTCRALNNLSLNKPIEFMTSRCVSLEDHTSLKTNEELLNTIYGSIAYNAAFVLIDAINPDGTMDKRVYENLGALKKQVEPLYKYWNPKAKMFSDVAFYTSLKGCFNPRGKNSHYLKSYYFMGEHLNALAKGMIEEHIPYDFVFKPNLNDELMKKQTIILSDVLVLDEEEVAFFTKYVENGGNLIVTGLTGMYDKTEGKRDDFALAEIMGVSYTGETEFDYSYFNPVNSTLFGQYNSSSPMISCCNSSLVKATDAEVMATLTLPVSHSRNAHVYSSAISNPPDNATDYPSVTINRYGKGKVMYISSPFECDEKEAQREIFINHIRYMMDKAPAYTAKAPKWMDTILYDDGDGKYRAVFLNAMEKHYDCVAQDLEMEINIKGITKAFSAKTGNDVPIEQTENGVKFYIDSIKDFDMIILS